MNIRKLIDKALPWLFSMAIVLCIAAAGKQIIGPASTVVNNTVPRWYGTSGWNMTNSLVYIDNLNNVYAAGFFGLGTGLTNTLGYRYASTNEANLWMTNAYVDNLVGNGEGLTNANGNGFASTNQDAMVVTNLTVLRVSYPTNQNNIQPDFTIAAQLMSTNANFALLSPVGVNTGNTNYQMHMFFVTNTAGNSTLTASPPANVHPVPLSVPMYVTNLSRFVMEVYGGNKFTNVYCVPIF